MISLTGSVLCAPKNGASLECPIVPYPLKGVTVDLRMDFADFEGELQRPISDT